MSPAEKQLRSLAAAAGYRSLRALAIGADLNRVALWKALAWGRFPRQRTVDKLARALGVQHEVVIRLFGGVS